MSDTPASQEQKSRGPAASAVVIVIVVLIVIIIIALLLRGQTTTRRDATQTDYVSTGLYCSGSGHTSDIYEEASAVSTQQELTASFRDDRLYELTFTYTSTYPDHATAEQSTAILHANYNLYANGVGLDSGIFEAHFGVDGDKMIATSHAKASDITAESAPLIMLSVNREDSTAKIPTTRAEWKSSYAAQSYICKEQD